MLRRFSVFLAGAITLFCATMAGVQSVHAGTLTVTTTADSGAGSLRLALADANDGDTIQFAAALNGQTIGLTSAELVIDENITISGPGPGLLAVSRDQQASAFRVFRVTPGRVVTISGLTIRNGLAPTAPNRGGGILNDHAILTVNNCALSGNSADFGGGILNDGESSGSASLAINASTLTGNTANFGAGVFSSAASSGSVTLAVTNSTLSDNSAATSGGGIFNEGDNGGTGTVRIDNSTLSGNTAVINGGALLNDGFAGNGITMLANCTLSGNTAGNGGSSGTVFNQSGSIGVSNTIFKAGQGANIRNSGGGTITSHGYNLSSDDGGGFLSGAGDQVNTDPILGPLQDNGGPTLTHAPLLGSPTIDAGDPNFAPPPDFDQRGPGFPRIANGRINVGSLEVQPVAPTPTPTPSPTPTGAPSPTTTSTPTTTPNETVTPTPTPTATPSPNPAHALNISTRLRVETGDKVMIGGFIITGTTPKKVAIRGIGPSLGKSGLTDVLADPTLELHDSGGALLGQDDNWQDDSAQAVQLSALGLAPQDPRESGMVATLQPGAYTTIMAGKDQTSGIGLVEIYDADTAAISQLANMSTRGFVQTGDNVLIGGFILGHGNGSAAVAVRGLGPSLSQSGLSNVLVDPTLELRDSNGAVLIANDNWQDDSVSAAQLTGHGLALQDSLEPGIFAILPPGLFTTILAGKDGGVGLGLVEVYNDLPAATLIVASMADSGATSLRDTIAAARDGDTIQVDTALNGQAISLTSDELVIDKNITIRGPGPDALEVLRDSFIGFRIFHVMPDRTVTIEGLTISNGFADFGGGIFADHATLTINNCSVENNNAEGQGGGIYNDGGSSATLRIVNTFVAGNGAFSNDSTVRGGGICNKSGALEIRNSHVDSNVVSRLGGNANGGGIYNDTGTLEIVDSSVGDNFAFTTLPDPHTNGSGSGIGIYNDINGTVAIRNSTVSGNYTEDFPFTGSGGGIYNTGMAAITDSTISGNFPSANGGGIYNEGTLTITNSTVRQNSTRNGGGGIYNGGPLTITNTTLSDNTAVHEKLGYGGGLVNQGPLTIINSTLSGNHADGGGGGIYNTGPLMITNSTLTVNFSYRNGLRGGGSIRNLDDGALQIGNTILNSGSVDATLSNSATIISRGYNLCSDDGGGFLSSRGDQISTDPMLGPHQDNGGPTFTYGLLPGSPALDTGDPTFTPPPFYDQRGPGYDRVYNGRIDIGSVEAQPNGGYTHRHDHR